MTGRQSLAALEKNPAVGLGLAIFAGLALGSGVLTRRLGSLIPSLSPVPSGNTAPAAPGPTPPAGQPVSVAGSSAASINATSQAPVSADPWGG